MKGQKLFVRPITTADRDAISRFLSSETGSPGVPECGLLGKLVGDLVAVVAMSILADAVQIDRIVVQRELRRKRIGRVMLNEVEEIAAKMDRSTVVVRETQGADEFFQRSGFEREGARWIRHVRLQGAERIAG